MYRGFTMFLSKDHGPRSREIAITKEGEKVEDSLHRPSKTRVIEKSVGYSPKP